jgi:starch synthase
MIFFCKDDGVRVLFASSEIVPFASTGGLGDVCAALPKALAKLNVEMYRIMPLYRMIDRHQYKIQPMDVVLQIPIGQTVYQGRLFKQEYEGVTTFYIHCPEYFDRDGIYGDPHQEYSDNFERFLFFQKAIVATIDTLDLNPDIVHCNDWHTGLLPLLLKYGIDGIPRFGPEKTVMTIHNLAHQGWAHAEKFSLTQLPSVCFHWKLMEFFGEINSMKAGLVTADTITTVSPTYAKEILHPEFGNQLEGVLYERKNSLHGILNGVDYSRWNTTSDPYIESFFDIDDLTGKMSCKKKVQEQVGLPVKSNIPLFCMISRLTHQKGLDLIDENIESIMELDAQWIFLGTGDNHYENKLIEWAKRWPEKIAVSIAYSSEQAHQLFAGSDLFLMPSIFEPCGQSQIYSMRYGTIPLAHAVGGLVDTIKSYPKRGSTGFLFQPFTSDAFMSAIQYTINTFHQPRRWKPLMKRAMRSDFSVRKMAEGYLDVYQGLIDTMD